MLDVISDINRYNVIFFFFSSPEHYATITMSFLDRNSETELKVECRGVPENEEERTKEGWKRYYFEAIKQTFGYGSRLYWRRCTVNAVHFMFCCFLFFFGFLIFLSFDLSGTRYFSVKLTARVKGWKRWNETGRGRPAHLSVPVNVLISDLNI